MAIALDPYMTLDEIATEIHMSHTFVFPSFNSRSNLANSGKIREIKMTPRCANSRSRDATPLEDVMLSDSTPDSPEYTRYQTQYLTESEVAELWGVSVRDVKVTCLRLEVRHLRFSRNIFRIRRHVAEEYLFRRNALRIRRLTLNLPSVPSLAPDKPLPDPLPGITYLSSPNPEQELFGAVERVESWHRVRSRVYIHDKGICAVCDVFVPLPRYECGHLQDRLTGGPNTFENCVVMCQRCNDIKPYHVTREQALLWIAKVNPRRGIPERFMANKDGR